MPAWLADLPAVRPDTPRLTSHPLGWKGLVLEERVEPPDDIWLPPLKDHLVTYYLRPPKTLEQRRDGKAHDHPPHRGQVMLLPAGQKSRWRWTGTSDILHLRLDPVFLQEVAESVGLDGQPFDLVTRYATFDPIIEHLALALLREVQTGGLGSGLMAESLTQALSVHLLREHSTLYPRSEHEGGLSSWQLKDVLAYMRDHLAEPLGLEDLARSVGLSPYHFARRFKRSTGRTVHAYVLEERLKAAKRLLLARQLPLSGIALEVGFADQSHLTRHFKRRYGLPPARWGRKNLP